MPQLPGDVVKERAARLRAKGEALMAGFLQGRVGKPAWVLVERDGFGHSEHYLPAKLAGTAATGAIVEARITGVVDGQLTGEAM
jgi:threonylcarbamoyladenosine tRNA methylthiotransferase MtaB